MNALPGQDPAHMRPQAAVLWRMWVTFFIRVLVMHTMYGDPENRAALQGECGTNRENVLHPFWCLVSSMR